jgi:RNA polymerase sigma-70 factor (ECF subfamily)
VRILTNAVAEDEAASPEEAYESHFDRVWRTLRRLGVTEDSLDDAAQDVFLVVFRRWGEFRGASSLRTWIYGIVLRVASSYRRARRRTSHATVDDRVESVLVANANPFDEASWREAARVLARVLESVDDPVRAVFVLVELEELTVEQASQVLEISEATCRSRLRTARAHVNGSLGRLRARDQWRSA